MRGEELWEVMRWVVREVSIEEEEKGEFGERLCSEGMVSDGRVRMRK